MARCQAATRSVHHLAPEPRPQAAEDQAAWDLRVAAFPQLRLLKVLKVQVEAAPCLVLGAILRRAAAEVEALQPAEGPVAWLPRGAARKLDRPFVEAASLARDLVGPATALPLAEPVAQIGVGVLPQMAEYAAVAPRQEEQAQVEAKELLRERAVGPAGPEQRRAARSEAEVPPQRAEHAAVTQQEPARAEVGEPLREVAAEPAWPGQPQAARSEAEVLPQGAEHAAVAPQQEPARAEAEEPLREVAVVPAGTGQRRAVRSEATAWASRQGLVLPSVQPEPQPVARFARAVARQSAAMP